MYLFLEKKKQSQIKNNNNNNNKISKMKGSIYIWRSLVIN